MTFRNLVELHLMSRLPHLPDQDLVGWEVDSIGRNLPSDGQGQAPEEAPEVALPDDAHQGLDGPLAVVVDLHLRLDQLHRGAHEGLETREWYLFPKSEQIGP